MVTLEDRDAERSEKLPMVQRRWFGPFILGLCAFLCVSVLYQQYARNALASCQQRYNTAFSLAVAERARSADQDRADLHDALAAILLAADPAKVQRVLQAYVTSLDQANQTREDTPLPTNRC